MKNCRKMLGILILAILFIFPKTVKANEWDYIHTPDDTLRDALSQQTKRYTGKQWEEKILEIEQQYDNGELTQAEYNQAFDQMEKQLNVELDFIDKYQIIKKEAVTDIKEIDLDWEGKTLYGLEYVENLETLVGEFSNPFNDFTPLRDLKKIRELSLEFTDIQSLKELKKMENLEILRLSGSGFASSQDEEEAWQEAEERGKDNFPYTQAALTDISALSNLENLNKINISTFGIMPTVTLKKGTTSYQMYDPIVTSAQFDGAKMRYESYSVFDNFGTAFISDEEVRWENLIGDEEYLTFYWEIGSGNFIYDGEAQVPIRWK